MCLPIIQCTLARLITSHVLHIMHTLLSISLRELCGNNFRNFDSRCYSGIILEYRIAGKFGKSSVIRQTTETFLDSSVLDAELLPFNYVVFRSDRNCHGGGLMVVVIDLLSTIRRYDLEDPDIELLWIQIFSEFNSLLFGVSYRPPSCSDYV